MSDDDKTIERHLAALLDDAKAFETTAACFRPEFEACWERDEAGKMGRMLNSERALQLRPLVLDNERYAKYNRKLHDAIVAAIRTPSP